MDRFPETRRIDIVQAWVSETRGASRIESVDGIEPVLRERLIACDSMPVDEALRFAADIVARVIVEPTVPVHGRIAGTPVSAKIETFYFDGAGDEDWPALVRLPGISLAFGRGWVFEPDGTLLG